MTKESRAGKDVDSTLSSDEVDVAAPRPAASGVASNATYETSSGDGAPAASGSDEVVEVLARGATVGRYLVLERLGEGAMGVAYAAYDPELDRKIALKLLRPQGAGDSFARRQARLVREAKAIAKLSHPNVVGIFDVGVHEGQVFMAMEYLSGGTLREWLASKKRPWREIVAMFIEVGRGLAGAHVEGLVHRDFKPDNVLLDKNGVPKVVDFGLVRLAGASDLTASGAYLEETGDVPAPSVPVLEPDAALTRTGALTGTPAYMAPEQFLGKPVDARTDQFAFCVALYEALYGERPFAGESVIALATAVTTGEVRSVPRANDVPGWVVRAFQRGLSVAPERRYPKLDDLLELLTRDPAARLRRRVGIGAVVVMIVVALVAIQRRAERRRVELEQQIASRAKEARTALASAGTLRARALDQRSRAFAAFDARRGDDGELAWKNARNATVETDALLARAEQALTAALAIDPSRPELQDLLGEATYGRAELAELEFRKADAARLLAGALTHDRTGQLKARWSAPGAVTLAVVPAGARVTVEEYRDAENGDRVPHAVPASGCAAGATCALAPGFYRLHLAWPDSPEHLIPFLVARGQRLTVSVRKPAAVPAGFAWVPAGRFIFGDYDEHMRVTFLKTVPAHETETAPYVISRTEVTFADWIAFLEQLPPAKREEWLPNASEKQFASLLGSVRLSASPDQRWRLDIAPIGAQYTAPLGQPIVYPARKENGAQDWRKLPVSGVSTKQIAGYLAWLSSTGRVPGARFCNELEWERAARGGDDRLFPHGDALEPADANHDATYGRLDAAFGPDAAGSHPRSRSPFGVDDMAGNVWELVASSLAEGEYVIRGGGYYFFQASERVTNREPLSAGARSVHVGFRVCASWDGQP